MLIMCKICSVYGDKQSKFFSFLPFDFVVEILEYLFWLVIIFLIDN